MNIVILKHSNDGRQFLFGVPEGKTATASSTPSAPATALRPQRILWQQCNRCLAKNSLWRWSSGDIAWRSGMKQSKKPVRAYFEGEEGVFVFRPIRKVLGKDKQKMNKLTFSERRRLSAEFEKWADENDVMKKPESVIAYLQSIGAIDADKAREVLKSEAD